MTKIVDSNENDEISASNSVDKSDTSTKQHNVSTSTSDKEQSSVNSNEKNRKNRAEMDGASIVFASFISRDLTEIIQVFATQPLFHFQSFKQLWKQHRMSAAFHVEFWDSNPTQIHQTILCSALELLVSNVVKEKKKEHAAHVIGSVFALYCAYSVQLSDPKLKIAVNPLSWMALSLVPSRLVDSVTKESFFPQAFMQVNAIMSKLFAENAFVKCLRGYNDGGDRCSKRQEIIASLTMMDQQKAREQAAHHIDMSEFSQLDAMESKYALFRDAIPPIRAARPLHELKDQRRALVNGLQQQLERIRVYNEEGLPATTSIEDKLPPTKCEEICTFLKSEESASKGDRKEDVAMEIGPTNMWSDACTDALLELEEELEAFTQKEATEAGSVVERSKSLKRSRTFSEETRPEKEPIGLNDGLDALNAELEEDVLNIHRQPQRLESPSELACPTSNDKEVLPPTFFASCEALDELERELQADVDTPSPHALNLVDTISIKASSPIPPKRKKSTKAKTQPQRTSRRRPNPTTRALNPSPPISTHSTRSRCEKPWETFPVVGKGTNDATNSPSRKVVQAETPSIKEDDDGLAELEAELAL
uniref:Uncharacterized protein AlNc14C43G3594 n=1 Tax=Albugo laibachii Nc14 TaxID=890382 RepID=F0WA50_9STRA|nr:conserved hypothetical protein [Albugo laibachii Nc14]|eukprot:CCA18020.1 conserved hypothetical protein [Albugo laibachii Nc14]